MSKTRAIVKTRKQLVDLVCSYISCARGINDLHKEGDFTDFKDGIDEILEKLLDKETLCA